MIGIGSPAFCSRPFARMAEKIAEHFEMWEVLSEGGHQLDMIRDELIHARDTLSLEFQVHAPMSDVNIGSVYEPMRVAAVREVRRVLELSRPLDVRVVTMHPGFVNGAAFLNRQKVTERTRQSIMDLAKVADEHGVIMAVENMPAKINATCTTAQELLEVVDGTGAAICFDMGHANTSGEIDNMLSHVSRFKNVHMHNNDGKFDQHNEVGDGTADLGRVVSVLKASYSGNIVIESTDLDPGVQSRMTLNSLLGSEPTS